MLKRMYSVHAKRYKCESQMVTVDSPIECIQCTWCIYARTAHCKVHINIQGFEGTRISIRYFLDDLKPDILMHNWYIYRNLKPQLNHTKQLKCICVAWKSVWLFSFLFFVVCVSIAIFEEEKKNAKQSLHYSFSRFVLAPYKHIRFVLTIPTIFSHTFSMQVTCMHSDRVAQLMSGHLPQKCTPNSK